MMRVCYVPIALVGAVVGGSPAASEPAKTITTKPAGPRQLVPITLSGYVHPTAQVVRRSDARPRDKWEYGAAATRAGLVITGRPWVRWSYRFEGVLTAAAVESVTGVELVDIGGDGVPDGVAVRRATRGTVEIEEATVRFRASSWLGIDFGRMRIPFTAQSQSSNTVLMFPARSSPNEIFQRGTDLGVLVTGGLWGGRLRLSTGVYNGTGVAPTMSNERGLLYAARVDYSPLGPLSFAEADFSRGSFRVGFGGGFLYFPSTVFDESGFFGVKARDLRATLSVRAAIRGFYAQAEVLRRQRTDSLSSRPLVATGGYLQSSYYWSFPSFGMAPLARVGWASEDQSFESRTTIYMNGGFAFYPVPAGSRPDRIKVTAQYMGEARRTERESAHGARVQLQVLWH